MPHKITIYTDGSARGNPGPGGYGVVLLSGNYRKELSQGFRHTTNNRMELLAVIVGLEALKYDFSDVTIYSDSKYVVEAIEKGWLNQWVQKRFNKTKNKDLWLRYLEISQKQNVRFIWIKGHAANVENECCDKLAVAASHFPDLLIDEWYESQVTILKTE
ncbi:MAG: ribonuclease HI [Bacteroidetes bacterium]|nr:ribonuclease HI [Bacteroidota bacterium]